MAKTRKIKGGEPKKGEECLARETGAGESNGEASPTARASRRKRKKGESEEAENVLKVIFEEAKKGSIKHQELYLKYIDLFVGNRGEDRDVIYEATFVDDKTEEDT